MPIIIDTREKHIDKIKELIISIPNIPLIKFEKLDKGDYDIQNCNRQLRIERKSISDFCNSYRILKPRLHDMRINNEYTALLLEGTYSMYNNMIWVLEGSHMQPRMSYDTYVRFLTHQVSEGTWLLHTMGLEESIYQILILHDYLPKLNAPNAIKCGNPTELLMQLPGIGTESMKKLKEFPTPLDALQNLPKRAKDSLSKW